MERAILMREVAAFRRSRDADHQSSRLAACLNGAGIASLADLSSAAPGELARAAKLLKRKIDRERIRGMARHRLYDLNRHISLKRALDAVLVLRQKQNGAEAPS